MRFNFPVVSGRHVIQHMRCLAARCSALAAGVCLSARRGGVARRSRPAVSARAAAASARESPEKVEREMQERSSKQPGGARRHVDAAALSILSRPPLTAPSRDHQRVLTPWRQSRTWRRNENAKHEDVSKALPQGFARPPWRGTVFPPKVERPGTRALFSSAEWQMDEIAATIRRCGEGRRRVG